MILSIVQVAFLPRLMLSAHLHALQRMMRTFLVKLHIESTHIQVLGFAFFQLKGQSKASIDHYIFLPQQFIKNKISSHSFWGPGKCFTLVVYHRVTESPLLSSRMTYPLLGLLSLQLPGGVSHVTCVTEKMVQKRMKIDEHRKFEQAFRKTLSNALFDFP